MNRNRNIHITPASPFSKYTQPSRKLIESEWHSLTLDCNDDEGLDFFNINLFLFKLIIDYGGYEFLLCQTTHMLYYSSGKCSDFDKYQR